MSQPTRRSGSIVLSTSNSLPMEIIHVREFTFDRWTATLNLRPTRDCVAAGIKTGKEVARAWSAEPPRRLHPETNDDDQETRVFVGASMFSVSRAEAAKLESWLVSLIEQPAEVR